MSLQTRIAKLEHDDGGGACTCPPDRPELRQAAEERFIQAVVHRRPSSGPLVCPICRQTRPALRPADADAERLHLRLVAELAEAEALVGIRPAPSESLVERVRRLLILESDAQCMATH